MPRIFQDDPDAIQKLEEKLAGLEKEKEYWKGLKPEKRTFQNETDNMKRSYMLPLTNQNIRSVKQKIDMIRERQERGDTLERKPTFVGGKKRFYYQEQPRPQTDIDNDPTTFARNGFMGMVDRKTKFTVGEGSKKEYVNRKKSNNIFDVSGMFGNKSNAKRKSNNIFDMGGF